MINTSLGRAIDEAAPPGHGCVIAVDVPRVGLRNVRLPLAEWSPPAPPTGEKPDPVRDIAVLGPLEGGEGIACPPLATVPPALLVDASFSAFGFMQSNEGTPTSGSLVAVDTGQWLVAHAKQEGQFFAAGLSGAPALSEEGEIIGMVVAKLPDASRQGLIIPGMVLARAWPLLARPYPGLRSFDERTAHLFFGRGRRQHPHKPDSGLIAELRSRLAAPRPILALVGTSGSGKSSLVRAGLISSLKADGWAALLFRPGEDPLRNLAEAIAAALHPSLARQADTARRGRPVGRAAAQRSRAARRGGARSLRQRPPRADRGRSVRGVLHRGP